MLSAISMSEFITLKNIKVLDVREDDEYASGHIPNSIHIPLFDIPSRLSELDINETYYVICRSGNRSQQACLYASQQGYNVVNILGGMSAYQGEMSYEM